MDDPTHQSRKANREPTQHHYIRVRCSLLRPRQLLPSHKFKKGTGNTWSPVPSAETSCRLLFLVPASPATITRLHPLMIHDWTHPSHHHGLSPCLLSGWGPSSFRPHYKSVVRLPCLSYPDSHSENLRTLQGGQCVPTDLLSRSRIEASAKTNPNLVVTRRQVAASSSISRSVELRVLPAMNSSNPIVASPGKRTNPCCKAVRPVSSSQESFSGPPREIHSRKTSSSATVAKRCTRTQTWRSVTRYSHPAHGTQASHG